MNIYKINYFCYDAADDVYTCERTWTIKTNDTLEEMEEYAEQLTKGLGNRTRNFFLVDEVIIQDKPDINEILDDVRCL